ncbi:hypothetical protein, partial [Phocaeicola sartorii]|uniref:hypothetical protein n=1 Tax=Phocaeicola sartorii TaxID=671267 RepID=UPI0025983AF5
GHFRIQLSIELHPYATVTYGSMKYRFVFSYSGIYFFQRMVSRFTAARSALRFMLPCRRLQSRSRCMLSIA